MAGYVIPLPGDSQLDPQSIWNVAVGAALAVTGWIARTFYTAIRDLENGLSAHKIEVARDYVTNTDLRRIEDKLDRVLDRLPK